jgi:SnoaL-like protein
MHHVGLGRAAQAAAPVYGFERTRAGVNFEAPRVRGSAAPRFGAFSGDAMDTATLARMQIREAVENWALWRDAGDWERFRTLWHLDGRMMATWFQGPADAFIRASREGFSHGVRILHFLGGTTIDVAGTRAIAQTKMTISQRADVDGVRCDVACTGRFYDFFEERDGAWKIVLRQPIYAMDRLDPLDPSAPLALDASLLAQFPEGYRHLAYAQTRLGFAVKRDMPQLTGAEVERLYADGAAWLAGRPLAR